MGAASLEARDLSNEKGPRSRPFFSDVHDFAGAATAAIFFATDRTSKNAAKTAPTTFWKKPIPRYASPVRNRIVAATGK